jgi:hypothetical protein
VATVVTVTIFLASKIVSNTNIYGISAQTHSRDSAIDAGQSLAQIASSVVGYDHADTAVRHVVAEFVIVVAHRFTDPLLEVVYTTDDMLDDMEQLLDPDFYRTLTGVSDVVGIPEITVDPELVGHVLQYEVTVQVAIIS